MTEFTFLLGFQDGTVATVSIEARRWHWSAAFAEACRIAEVANGRAAYSGVRCLSYSTRQLPAAILDFPVGSVEAGAEAA